MNSGIDVNILFNTGWTALMYAAQNAAPESIDFLIRHGANPNVHKGLQCDVMLQNLTLPNFVKFVQSIMIDYFSKRKSTYDYFCLNKGKILFKNLLK